MESRKRKGDQRIFGRFSGRCDRLDNAAALRRDFSVGRAGEATLKLLASIAGEDEVRVGVDESRNQRAAGGIDTPRLNGQR